MSQISVSLFKRYLGSISRKEDFFSFLLGRVKKLITKQTGYFVESTTTLVKIVMFFGALGASSEEVPITQSRMFLPTFSTEYLE